METVLVNRAAWSGAPEVPDGWVIANAPRPLQGQITWTGPFRHGVFYAASPQVPGGTFGWAADDAWLVVFTTNDEIEDQVLAKFAEYGYLTAEEAGVTIGDQAYSMGLPWHED